MKLKRVMRWDRDARLLRVRRVTWGDGHRKLSLGLRRRLFAYRREWDGWLLTVLGVRVHYQRSYGGRYAD